MGATLVEDLAFDKPLTCYRPVEAIPRGGTLQARPVPYVGSGDLHVLAVSNGVVELDAGENEWPAGTTVPYYAWP